LLDLTTRNRLISTSRSRSSRLIEIRDANGPEIYRELVTDGLAVGFAPRDPENDSIEPGTELVEVDTLTVQPRRERRLLTFLTAEGLRARLLALHLDAKTFEEEQGVGILYVAIGFLRWYEAADSDVDRYAPLLLVPVNLDRGTAREQFKLRWNQEDPAANLSLIAMLRREHGVALPESNDEEDFDPEAYFASVSAAISDQPRWTVKPNDVVVGFFSFAKFLMYRDLDAENWPEHAPVDAHPIVSALLGDGFDRSGGLLPEEGNLDEHLPSATTLHVLDADSSQSVVIEETKRGRNLVVQGPPGTGKSQTIANIIAAAVNAGKSVLFVAEKMAALDVVKRRLDAVGVGEMCLELHSKKANKRAVLQELNRTWLLGSPSRGADGDVIETLDAVRQKLNAHPARLHARDNTAKLSPYEVMGHLIRLRRKGVAPTDVELSGASTWSPADRDRLQREVADLAAKIDEIGLPNVHAWRGAMIDVVIPTDLQRLASRIELFRSNLVEASNVGVVLRRLLNTEYLDSLSGHRTLASLGSVVVAAPECDTASVVAASWDTRRGDIEELVRAGNDYSVAQSALKDIFSDVAWTTDVRVIRQQIAARGASWFRWFAADWRRTDSLFRSLVVSAPLKDPTERLAVLDRLISGQQAKKIIDRADALGSEAFGRFWRREQSDWPALRSILGWVAKAETAGLGIQARQSVGSARELVLVGELANRLCMLLDAIATDSKAICAAVNLAVHTAFAPDSIDALEFPDLIDRCASWLKNIDALPNWIAYRGQAERLRNIGLNEFVERLADGRLTSADARDEFEMAYYEAVFRFMAKKDPEILAFDGHMHVRKVDEFKQVDLLRINLARLEVAASHHCRLPARQGIGRIGVLRTEIAKQKRLLPIRRLVKRAGAAMQAIKPVFMMSPLSMAQFLEPGAITFDMLVIDEASQVRPVDALGAVSRCRQIVVVGDERQLPPTAFFSKLASDGDGDDDDEDTSNAVNVESILGLCAARGVPERVLRWHYRSKHESLIAVSNHEFYDSQLYIVPSPSTERSTMGLHFRHVPQGTFDVGGTRSNRVEARVVAAAVMNHARIAPDLSLGVVAFSAAQRRAIVDELEMSRRQSAQTEEFFTAHPNEPFFVKNLENVQGDERDVMFISVGYGRNQQGRMLMRFPTLGSEGGERRLNVLITRAKRRCEVFSSITDEDIDLDRAHGQGVAAFKLFLRYARTGDLDMSQPTGREFDSVFEEQVADALTRRGYLVKQQVGQSGFFIDLAVVDPERPGRYLIGIECDGAAYHSSRAARDRDRLRQAVLEDHGWTIHRIWSTDWFKQPDAQLRETIKAIEATQRDAESEMPRESTDTIVEPTVSIARTFPSTSVAQTQEAVISVPYGEASFAVSTRHDIHEVSVEYLTGIIRRIIEFEAPIHEDEIVIRVRTLWGQKRAGGRIQSAVQRGLRTIDQIPGISREGPFYLIAGAPLKIRDRSQAISSSLRRPEMLPPVELRAALLAVVEKSLGADREEGVTSVSRAVGFRATSGQLRAIIEEQIRLLLQAGELLEADGRLSRPRAATR
jgi:very-short-patch-repair endonuclease